MKKKLLYNLGSTLLLEVVSLVCAFVLPRLIMVSFGSEYNGIVSSVSQFLSFVTLLRGGVGGVTRAALYKPLNEHDDYKISGIVNATELFMRKVCYIFIVALVVFAAIYPLIIKEQFDWLFTFSLVLILGISTITQYYFGITYQMLLQADQRQYVYSILQMLATILNTLISVFLIRAGIEFRLVKLSSALVFGVIPVILYYYVRKHYRIMKNVPCDNSAIKQRWDAFAHQVAAFVHSNTDLVILTLFADLFEVSIYTVYFMVANGVKRFVNIFTNGVEAALGNILAKGDIESLRKGVHLYDLVIHFVSTICFACAAFLIVPFVLVYTKGVTDANYNQPIFGYLLCLSMFVACIRLPYQNVVEAAGHFKQTRNGAIWEACINVIITIPFVIKLGCTGAVIGTIIATTFRTVQYALYAEKNILHEFPVNFFKRILVSLLNVLVLCIPFFVFGLDKYMVECSSYFMWLKYAIVTFVIVLVVTLAINFVFYCRDMKQVLPLVIRKKRI